MDSDVNGIDEGGNDITDDAQALVNATTGAVDEKIIAARNRLSTAMDTARKALAKAQARAVDGARATDKVIRNNPYRAIGIAFGVGAVIGFLLGRRED
jgi:ElaB/YqjD/DUF883 family membrane-anchored ribosome-binding protein